MGAVGTGRGVVLVIVGVGMQPAAHVGERVMAHLLSVFVLIRTSAFGCCRRKVFVEGRKAVFAGSREYAVAFLPYTSHRLLLLL